ncbi:DUF4952 domain-containing protein [Flavobacteriaceae bacterium]|nr:DUF4952 domain-containing protein [Flavobacteriaceae bacterium]
MKTIKNLIVTSIAIVLLILKLFVGVYEEDEFFYKDLFVKHRPVWKTYFYSPRGMSDKTLSEMPKKEKREQIMYDEFILNKKRYTTSDGALNCGDLLEMYAEKPTELEFIKCEKKTKSAQVLCEASYKVAGKDAEKIENYLVDKYGMGKLYFTCCGWDTGHDGSRHDGNIHSQELVLINPNYIMVIAMWGDANVENEKGEFRLEFDRTKIDFLYVQVRIYDL